MKIIEIISSLSSGGAERFVVSVSNQLFKDGHDVILCSMNDNENINFNKQFLNHCIKYHSFQIKGKPVVSIWKDMYIFLKKEQPDIVHCHLAVLQYVFPICLFYKKIRIVHTIHSMPKYASGGTMWHAKLFKMLYRSGLVIPVTISKECHLGYKEFYHLDNDIIIENGVSQAVSTYAFEKVRKEVEKYKTGSETKVFIHVARFHEHKNQTLLVKAFNRLNAEGVDFILLVIGEGFDSEKGMVLQNIACRKIHFLGLKNNVSDYLKCSDYFCLSSRNEGLPISLLEAMSLGITPICTPVGGMKNVIRTGINGYLSVDSSLEGYVSALRQSMKNPIDKQFIVEDYENHYSISCCVRKYVELFENVKSNKNK